MRNTIFATSSVHRFRLPRSSGRRAEAFTLIELLTVVAIIGILAAIIIPVVGKVRQTARATQCASLLRQWGAAIQLYANDNKGYYVTRYYRPTTSPDETPKNVSWSAVNDVNAHPYMQYMVNSGQAFKTDFRMDPAQKITGASVVSYSMINPHGRDKRDPIPLYTHPAPSRFLVMIDRDSDASYDITGTADELHTQVEPLFSSPKDRHGSAINAVFADGHVSRVKLDEIKTNAERWTSLD